MNNELLGLPYSPWSEKAKWALDVRKVPYRFVHYQPLIGEPALRFKTKRWMGVVSVPVMTASNGTVYDDSAKIARFADGTGDGPALFPKEHTAAIDEWIELGERALNAGRVLSLYRTLANRDACLELVPRNMRSLPLAAGIGAMGVRRTLRKYGARKDTLGGFEKTLRDALDRLRATLAKSTSTPKTVLGTFTFADIAATQMLSFVSPPAFGLRLGKHSRNGFTDPAIARDYADLVAWRDAIYEAYRPRS